MVAVTAALVGKLRAKTDAPMMECKKALTEADGDLDKAEEILRVKLGNKASKASSRIAAEGIVASYIDNGVGALVEVNCETDFVTKNAEFIGLAQEIAEIVAKTNPADLAALNATKMANGKTVDEYRLELVGRIGENMTVRRFQRFVTDAKLVSYLHGSSIGVVVEYAGEDQQIGKDVAMHIAAMKPVSLSVEQVPADLISKERSVAEQKAAESGKPADIAQKMIEGSVQKFLKEVSLFNQPFVKNDKQTVEQMLKSANTEVKAFTMYVVGEGIEKKEDNFAAEVAAQVAAATKA